MLAQQNGINANMLFEWRRELRTGLFEPVAPALLPVLVKPAMTRSPSLPGAPFHAGSLAARRENIPAARRSLPRLRRGLRPLGEDVAGQLEWIPGSFRVIRHTRPKLACKCCDTIMQAPAPSRPIAHGVAGPGLLAHVLVAKFADHLHCTGSR